MSDSPDRVRPRFPAGVYRQGTEPDPRFTLANERTFLAWITTGLALISVGVGLQALAVTIQPTFRLVAASLLMLAGTVCPTLAYRNWMRVEAALRASRPLPPARMSAFLVVTLTLTGVLLLIGSLVTAGAG